MAWFHEVGMAFQDMTAAVVVDDTHIKAAMVEVTDIKAAMVDDNLAASRAEVRAKLLRDAVEHLVKAIEMLALEGDD